jgi:hypothetical protein
MKMFPLFSARKPQALPASRVAMAVLSPVERAECRRWHNGNLIAGTRLQIETNHERKAHS